MPYDFDKVIDRKKMNAYKWQVADGDLPMWVADMDFDTAPQIKSMLQNRLQAGAFGYNTVPDSFFQSYIDWWDRRHGYRMDKDWLMFCTGAVPAISSIIRKVTAAEDKVLVLSPIYNIFYHSIRNNGRELVESRLIYQDGQYAVDYQDLEEKLADHHTSLLIFCNPHNPTGHVWSRQELEKIGSLCLKYNVLILSDELHCDLTHPSYTYLPFASISKEIEQICMTCLAPSKAFNLAGLQSSAISVANPELRKLVIQAINRDEIAEPNTLAIPATEAAFNESEDWLDALNSYLTSNREYLSEQLTANFPELTLIAAQATYLAWIDCSAICQDSQELCDFIHEETGLILSAGAIFGGNGRHFLRWNYACPRRLLEDGLDRFTRGLEAFGRKQ